EVLELTGGSRSPRRDLPREFQSLPTAVVKRRGEDVSVTRFDRRMPLARRDSRRFFHARALLGPGAICYPLRNFAHRAVINGKTWGMSTQAAELRELPETWKRSHLLGLEDLTAEELHTLL